MLFSLKRCLLIVYQKFLSVCYWLSSSVRFIIKSQICPRMMFHPMCPNTSLFSVVCAVVSHPPDTIVSYMNKAKGSTFSSSAKALGFMGLWKGLVPRTIMIGTLTALQWFIYDVVKVIILKLHLLHSGKWY